MKSQDIRATCAPGSPTHQAILALPLDDATWQGRHVRFIVDIRRNDQLRLAVRAHRLDAMPPHP